MRFSDFERGRRAAARTALYGGLALSLSLTLLAFHLGRPDPDLGLHVDWYHYPWESMEEVRLLQEYVRIDTTSDNGREIDGARFLAARLEEAGIPYHLEALGERHANLWAILEGEERQALVLHNHIDTDPIRFPEVWQNDPLGGEVRPPYIIGRGVFDMKSVAIAQLLAFIELKKTGVTPRRSVIFLATSSEEVGSDLGTRWVLREHPELRERMWGVLTEGGVLEMRDLDDLKYWGIELAQKTFVDLWVCSEHREPLEELRQDLLEIGLPIEGLRAPEEVRSFLEVYAPTRDDPELVERLSDLDSLLASPGEFLKLSPYLRSLFRDEAVAFPVEKVEGGGFRMRVKLHLLPGTDAEEARRRLLPPGLFHGFEVIWEDPLPPHHGSSSDHPLFLTAAKLMRERRPDAVVGPVFLPWTATDSRFFRAAGIPSYGFSPFTFSSFETYRVGGPHERVSLLGYAEGVSLYKDLLGELVGVEIPNPPLEERVDRLRRESERSGADKE